MSHDKKPSHVPLLSSLKNTQLAFSVAQYVHGEVVQEANRRRLTGLRHRAGHPSPVVTRDSNQNSCAM
ncbi:unnamed protein product [Arabidopsis thaliana]|uniref:(thale cress) hypothetical protein n=1 Tax=Arabidopsis thaliana TaxID=3702 RepID=A0A7G2ECK3_ARATH|nr:unnamed protein product [Arabidopsis thaliana]